MKKAIIVSADGAQDVEVIYPTYRLEEAGYEVFLAAPDCKPFAGIKAFPFVPNIPIRDLALELRRTDLLVLPGGVKAMEKLRLDRMLLECIRLHDQEGGVIASICSGAQLLISADIVRGRKVTTYIAMKIDIENAGATYIDAPAVVDGRLVSSPHYKHLAPWMAEVLRVAGEQ